MSKTRTGAREQPRRCAEASTLARPDGRQSSVNVAPASSEFGHVAPPSPAVRLPWQKAIAPPSAGMATDGARLFLYPLSCGEKQLNSRVQHRGVKVACQVTTWMSLLSAGGQQMDPRNHSCGSSALWKQEGAWQPDVAWGSPVALPRRARPWRDRSGCQGHSPNQRTLRHRRNSLMNPAGTH